MKEQHWRSRKKRKNQDKENGQCRREGAAERNRETGKKMDRMGQKEERIPAPEKILENMLRLEILELERTLQNLDRQSFEQAAGILEQADTVYLVGLRNSAPLAAWMYGKLRLVLDHVVLVDSSSDHELLEQMISLSGRDAVFGISFPRYSMRTLKLLEFADSRQAAVITLTDREHSPLNLYSSCKLTAGSHTDLGIQSLTAPMAVLNALTAVLYERHRGQVMQRLKQVEQVLGDYQIFGNDEINLLEESMELRPFPENEKDGAIGKGMK